MNNGWDMSSIGEVCEILDSKRKPITKRDRVSGPYPYYGATGILDHVEEFLFDERLVLLGEDGAKWDSGDKSAFIIEGKSWVNNHAHVLRPKRDIIDDQWLTYYLNHQDLQQYVTGLTVPKLNQGRMKEIPIPLTTLEEQERIVAKLDKAFAAIDQAKANVEHSLLSVNELFESCKELILRDNCEQWQQTTLGNSCQFFNGKAHEKDIDEDGDFIVVNSKFISTQARVKKFTAKQMFPLHVNDIVMVMSDVPNGKALAKCFFIDEDNKYSLNQRICAIRTEEFFPNYLFHQLNRHRHLLEFNNGENQTNLRKGDILNTPLFCPPMEEQVSVSKKLDKLVQDISDLKLNHQEKLTKLKDLKKSLLERAFRGDL